MLKFLYNLTVFSDPEFHNSKFGPTPTPYPSKVPSLGSIFIPRPKDDPAEAYRLYKENHNSARANKEWNFLNVAYNKTLGRIYGKVKEY